MNSEIIIKAIDYQIEQNVANYIRTKALYEEMKQELERLKEIVGIIQIEDEPVASIIHKLEYTKTVLYQIEDMEKSLEEILKVMEDTKNQIKIMYGRKKAIEKLAKKREKINQQKENKKEQLIAEEIYTSRHFNSE